MFRIAKKYREKPIKTHVPARSIRMIQGAAPLLLWMFLIFNTCLVPRRLWVERSTLCAAKVIRITMHIPMSEIIQGAPLLVLFVFPPVLICLCPPLYC